MEAPSREVLLRLVAVLEDRKAKRPEGSYTTELFRGGIAKIGAKVMEEAAEVVEAARSAETGDRRPLVHEAADLLFHLLVLMVHGGVALEEVEAELARRFGISGLEEKARRGNAGPRDGA